MYLNASEEGMQGGCVFTPYLVVVTPDLQVTGAVRIRVVETTEQVIYRRVGDVDLLEGVVLPEFLRIAQLDVGEALRKVVFQGALVDEGIAGEFVTGRTVASVTIAQDDVFCLAIFRYRHFSCHVFFLSRRGRRER